MRPFLAVIVAIGCLGGSQALADIVPRNSTPSGSVIARKLGEEAVEAVVAALTDNRDELVGEAADVLFHLLVLLAEKGIPLAEVMAELDRREGTSGLAEKAARA